MPEIPDDNSGSIKQLFTRISALEEEDSSNKAKLQDHGDRLTNLENDASKYATKD